MGEGNLPRPSVDLASGAKPERGAIVSACGLYRYRLWRRWDDLPTLIFIMLNPSTADAEADDPTIRKCIGFAQRRGCGGIVVFNLFAFRATDPNACRAAPERKGPDNDGHLRQAFGFARSNALTVIAAWGKTPWAQPRARTVAAMAKADGVTLSCLGKNNDGSPKHPLYVPYEATVIALSDGASSRPLAEPDAVPGAAGDRRDNPITTPDATDGETP